MVLGYSNKHLIYWKYIKLDGVNPDFLSLMGFEKPRPRLFAKLVYVVPNMGQIIGSNLFVLGFWKASFFH